MSKSQEVKRGVFPEYRTRAEYRTAFGAEAPEFNQFRKIKYWLDLNAGEDGLPEVIYPNTIMENKEGQFVLRNGKPIVRQLNLSVEEAKSVNLPPEDGVGNTGDVKAQMPPVQNPFRDLLEGEELVVAGPDLGLLNGQVIVIRNTKLWEAEQKAASESDGKFTAADREKLWAIAVKLGV